MIKNKFKTQKNFIKPLFSFNFWIFSLSFLFCTSPSFAVTSPSSLGKDLKKVLNSLPEKSITLNLILDLGIQSSDDFKLIQNRHLSANVPYWNFKDKSKMDYYFSGGFYFLNDKTKSKSRVEPESLKNQFYFLKVSKTFETGTQISGQWNYGFTDTTYSQENFLSLGEDLKKAFLKIRSLEEFYSSEISFSLSQDLWKNSFGRGFRSRLQSSLMKKDIRTFEVEEGVENWTLQMIEIFYKAWFQQKRIKFAKENFKRQNRWLKVTKIKASRGTAKRSDLLQLKSASLFSKQKREKAQQDLENLWRSLVISLKLPEFFISIDPFFLPMKTIFQRKKTLKSCKSNRNEDLIFNENTEIQKLKKRLQSTKLMKKYWRDQMQPKLSLNTSIGANSIDRKSHTAIEDNLTVKHPFWKFGVVLDLPLSYFRERSELAKSIEDQTASEILLRKRKAEIYSEWINQCQNLQRISDQVKSYQKAYEMQKERSHLEERRFHIGQTPVSNVIQAGDDVTRAESALYESMYHAEIVSWKIHKIQGYILKYLKSRILKQAQKEKRDI